MTSIDEKRQMKIVSKVLKRYQIDENIDENTVNYLGGFHNWVYEVQMNGKPFILRISHESYQTPERVKGEIHWIQYLWENGVSVSRAVPSLEGRNIEEVEVEGKTYPAVIFEKAPGTSPKAEHWNKKLFHQMGQFVGRMHALTKKYKSHLEGKRPQWNESLDLMKAYLDVVDDEIQEKFNEIRNYPETLPGDIDSYGLIHSDFHAGNFFIHNGTITLFDFDDCLYSWFAEDIAMALYYAVFQESMRGMAIDFPRIFFDSFMNGYEKENSLEAKWINEISYFMKQREINMYIVLTAKGMTDHWFMEGRRERIINSVPYLDMNSLLS